MQLRLRTKLTLVMTGLVLLMVAVLSGVFLAQLLQQTLLETDKRASDLAHQVFVQAQHALTEAAGQGLRPSSEDPDDVHDYVRRAFEINAGLQAQLEAAISSPSVYEVSIADDDGLVLISNDESLPGKTQARRPPLLQLVQSGFIQQVKVLRGPSKLYEYDYPFNMASKPFGEVRVVLSSGLLLNEMAPSLKTSGTIVLLALVTSALLAVVVSPAAEKFLGASSGEFLGRRAAEIFPEGHPLRAVLHLEGDELREVAAETELATSGGFRRVGVSVQAIQEGGERIGALVTLRDLDSLESINTQLQVSERLAALGRITAGVAHEVKNPLNSMRIWLENLKESLPADQDAGAMQAVNVLDKEIDRLDAVVKRFLDFTRPMDIRLEATQLSHLLPEVLELAQPQLQKANIQLAQLLPIDVPEVYVDRALLKQAVLNLVLNAAEAMPNGGQLSLVLSRRGEMAEITVADTGKGIPPENKQKIFQLFFTTRPGGSGIGLASAFRIVQLHNGSIDFTSEVGRGTTFRIELPLAA